jgi:hypothetical protein
MRTLAYLLSALAGAALASIVAPEYVPHVVLGLFAVCIALSWSVVAKSGALVKGPGALLGQFNPLAEAPLTRYRSAFFCSAAAVAGACTGVLLRVMGVL